MSRLFVAVPSIKMIAPLFAFSSAATNEEEDADEPVL
jgi:hypothetical protein